MGEMMAKQTILCALDEIEAEVTSWRHFFANTKSGWRWIPCSERLPNKADHTGDMVLVCYRNGSVRFNTYMNGWAQGNPVAWMPLPEPYKEDDHETD